MASPFQYVSFAGVSLSCATPELLAKVNRILPVSGFVNWDAWNFANAGTNPSVLPLPPAPYSPPPEVGVLHWPNDATRPAWFHALVSKSRLDQINAVYESPNQPQDLVLRDGRANRTMSASMSMLPPRPISQLGLQSDGWLLTFTDARFWWQWKSGSITETPASWASLFSQLGTILGVSISVDTVDAAYESPTDKWVGYLRSPAAVLDAAAASVGQRVIVGLDGSVRTVNWETAKQESDDQWDAAPTQSLGGYIGSNEIAKTVPSSVTVAGIDETETGPNGETVPKTEQVTLASLEIESYGPALGVADTSATAFVDFNYTGADDDAAWTDIVQAAGEDWYGWRLADLDVAFPGIVAWGPTGWEDFVEWMVALTDPWLDENNPHEPLVLTTVRRPPWNDFPSTILPISPGGSKTYYVKLTGSGTGPDGGTAWAGRIQKEVSGVVIDGDWIGDDATDYVMYATKAVNGASGNPEIGDIVHASPDPLRAGIWLFQPKLFSESRDCSGISFINSFRVGNGKCLQSKNLGGYGDCECVEVEDEWHSHKWDDTLDGFARLKMLETCCGCGIFVVKPGQSGTTATGIIKGVHITCETGSGVTKIVDINLSLDCAGREADPETGDVYDYVIFAGWGIKPCPDVGTECLNYFRVKVRCHDGCVTDLCDCGCGDEPTPVAWKFQNAGFTSDARQKYNGWWTVNVAGTGDAGRLYWEDQCQVGGVNVKIEYILTDPYEDSVYRLTFGDMIYEMDALSWVSDGENTFTWVSGGDPEDQDTITISPLGQVTRVCDPEGREWPEEVTIEILEVTTTGGAITTFAAGQTFTIPRHPSGDWTPILGWATPATNPLTLPNLAFVCSNHSATLGCHGFVLSGLDGNGYWGFCIGAEGCITSSQPESTIDTCSCDPLMLEGESLWECIVTSGCTAQAPFGSTVLIRARVTE